MRSILELIEMKCSFCQTDNLAEARTCSSCGQSLYQFDNEKFIGRNSQLNALMALGETVQAGLGRVCLITGGVGVGKSRLISEWKARWTAKHPNLALKWIQVRIPEQTEKAEFICLRSLLAGVLRLPMDYQVDDLKDRLSPYSNCASIDIPNLAEVIIETHSNRNSISGFENSALQDAFVSLLKCVIVAQAQIEPVILILDDLQYADPLLIEGIQSLLAIASEAPVLICLVSAKPAQGFTVENWANVPKIISIPLEPLSSEESNNLISNLFNAKTIPDGFFELIHSFAEGNPWIMLESLQLLLDEGILVHEGGRWKIPMQVTPLKIPGIVSSFLKEKVSTFSEVEQKILKTASVLGREFEVNVLENILEMEITKQKCRQTLSMFEAMEIITLKSVQPGLLYRFNDAALHQYLLESLDPQELSRLHLNIARTMEAVNRDSLAAFSSHLAFHYFEGGDLDRARQFFKLGAETALASHNRQEAEENFRSALALTDLPVEKAYLLSGLGKSLSEQGRYGEAVQSWLDALAIYKDQSDYDQVARIYAWLSRAAWWMNDLEQNIAYCQAGKALLEGKLESPGSAFLMHECGRTALFNNNLVEAEKFCKIALRMAKELNAPDVQAEVLATMGIFPSLSARESVALLEQAIEIAETNNLASSAARAYINLAAIVENMGQIQLALGYRERAVKLGMNTGNLKDEFYIQSGIINNRIQLCQFEQAKADLTNVRQAANLDVDLQTESLYGLFLESQLELQLGNFAAASDLILAYVRAQRQRNDKEQLMAGNVQLCRILLDPLILEDSQSSKNNLDIALALLQEHLDSEDGYELTPEFYGWLALVHALKDNQSASEMFWLKSKELLVYGASRFDQVQTQLINARIETSRGNYRSALKIYKDCLSSFDAMETRWWQEHTWLEMAIVHIHLGDAEDLEQAQNLLRDSLSACKEMKIAYYPDLVIEKLRIIKQRSRELAQTSRTQKRELSEAGKVQTNFIPTNPPKVPGWEIAAKLEPARETSGDYYDFVELPDGRIGIFIADVGDKGAGAALYMALSRTLVRTFAMQDGQTPEKLMYALNQRIMQDTKEGIYLTLVYGIFDPISGNFTYSNAGHNPPILIRSKSQDVLTFLEPNGMLVGLFKEGQWHQQEITLGEGELVLLYTDGITEAENKQGDFYGERRLKNIIHRNLNKDAEGLMDAIVMDVHNFIGTANILDDITLMVIRRQ